MDKKLTLSLDGAVIERAKAYARNRNTSLSKMIERYLSLVTAPESEKQKETFTPLVNELSGIVDLSEDYDYKENYGDYLAKKYR
ncbi:hypothetical protein LEM8419_02614 [Neolewinella maritima]|uniref:Antitoxin n=1 Tax=Neolewinella maritima TaxID=1383882 RepID=A0ABM9B2Y8_9BACT|nr:DUF6364 family protein [Neolewinella maritima]CAH1001708.1 hypothetical protein LEM8419_02614 [Neolewinella maritima]